jgi:DNA polymerase-3 subunit gamma/tau
MSDDQNYEPFVKKYRPKKLNEVVGQKVAVGIIESMLSKNEIAPCILITGEFGTGKTTLARIIAIYVNCESGKGCGTCRSCVAMDKGSHPDVTEVNAADSRGIDTIRDLVTISQLAPRFEKRVIILDEAHALTPQAASALLKPLEEPSKRTIWILCTTDAQKILSTIKSRSRQIKLLPAPAKSIQNLLQRICTAEGVPYPEKALEMIATLADGHPRNAVHMLESVKHYATSNGMPENLEEVLPKIIDEMSSIPPEILCTKYVQLLLDGDYKAIQAVQRADNKEYFMHIVFKYLRGVVHMMYNSPTTPEIEMFMSQTQFKRSFNRSQLLQLMDLHLNGLEQAKRYGVDAADVLDMVVLKCLELMQTAPQVKS